MDKLKACPFCGSTNVVYREADNDVRHIICNGCMLVIWNRSPEEWNQRTPGLMERVKEECEKRTLLDPCDGCVLFTPNILCPYLSDPLEWDIPAIEKRLDEEEKGEG